MNTQKFVIEFSNPNKVWRILSNILNNSFLKNTIKKRKMALGEFEIIASFKT